jgi:hypothetical protein
MHWACCITLDVQKLECKQESISKQIQTRLQNGTMNTNTQESIEKSLDTKRRNGTLDPGKYKASCIVCRKAMGTPQLFRWHGVNCPNYK